jgi:hypothetical protein
MAMVSAERVAAAEARAMAMRPATRVPIMVKKRAEELSMGLEYLPSA